VEVKASNLMADLIVRAGKSEMMDCFDFSGGGWWRPSIEAEEKRSKFNFGEIMNASAG
jgi:hypothetical protein